MSKAEVLKQIKDAEAKVTKGIEEAKKKKERIIADAKMASHEQIEKAQASARRHRKGPLRRLGWTSRRRNRR